MGKKQEQMVDLKNKLRQEIISELKEKKKRKKKFRKKKKRNYGLI